MSPTPNTTDQGFCNHETLLAATYLAGNMDGGNETRTGVERFVRAQLDRAVRSNESLRTTLADGLKQYVEGKVSADVTTATARRGVGGLAADLLSSALASIDWLDLADVEISCAIDGSPDIVELVADVLRSSSDDPSGQWAADDVYTETLDRGKTLTRWQVGAAIATLCPSGGRYVGGTSLWLYELRDTPERAPRRSWLVSEHAEYEVDADTREDAIEIMDEDGPEVGSRVKSRGVDRSYREVR